MLRVSKNTRRLFMAPALFACVLALQAPARADDGGLYRRHMTNPDTLCGFEIPAANFIAADPIERPKPRYPSADLANWSEGWVRLRLTVGADGVPRDIEVVDVLGSKDIVSYTKNAVADWRYKPATRKGKPVNQYGVEVFAEYLFSDSDKSSVHPSVSRAFNRAKRMIVEKDFDGAIAVIESALKARLNQYESAMLQFELASAYIQTPNWRSGLIAIHRATAKFNNSMLPKDIIARALQLRIDLDVRNGDLNDAICTYQRLRKHDAAAAADPETAHLADAVLAALQSPNPLAVEGALFANTDVSATATWSHPISRRKFYFSKVTGRIGAIKLICALTVLDAAFDPEMQWTIPDDAGTCNLTVTGDDKASFTLVEEW